MSRFPSRSPQRTLPHNSASTFHSEKRRHLATICNSPNRQGRRESHPYESPGNPHFSQGVFESEKRVHKTDILQSPDRHRPRSPAKLPAPRINDPGPPYHTSQRELAIEKVEHLTPIYPDNKPQKPEPRSPEYFRHKSHNELSSEIHLCKTPIYPVSQEKASRPRVVDNFLNYRPHPQDYMHTSCNDLEKEKRGHLTELHSSPPRHVKKEPPRAPSPADHGLQTSHQSLSYKKHRHSTELASSTHRSRSCDQARDLSPLYSSVQRFSHDKQKHRATISSSPSRPRPEPSPGYHSHAVYSDEKKRHTVSVSPRLMRTATPAKPHDRVDLHTSNLVFSEDKRKHITDIHSSPARSLQPSQRRSLSANFTSRHELAKAKRGHHVSVGGGSTPRREVQQPVHSSNDLFSSEKRLHRASIGNVYPPSPAPGTPPTSSFKSHARFAESKKVHTAEMNTFSRKSQSRSPVVPTPSPQRMVSHAMLRSEKAKHTMVMDSPQRAPPPDAPLTPPSLDAATLSRHSSRGSMGTPMRVPYSNRSRTQSEISYPQSLRSRSTEPVP